MGNEAKSAFGGRKIFLFMMVSLDGYMEGPDHDLSWHTVDEEFNDFAVKQLEEAGTILFGRKTYQLMESYWPTKDGVEDDPAVAKLMNETEKIVISKSLKKVVETDTWKHIRLIKDNITEEIKKLKEQPGKSIVVLGSNNLCVTLLQEGLLDEVRIMLSPVVIGNGTQLFHGIQNKKSFHLISSRNFTNGNVLLTYSPKLP